MSIQGRIERRVQGRNRGPTQGWTQGCTQGFIRWGAFCNAFRCASRGTFRYLLHFAGPKSDMNHRQVSIARIPKPESIASDVRDMAARKESVNRAPFLIGWCPVNPQTFNLF